MIVNHERARELAQRLGVQPGCCYWNVVRVLKANLELRQAGQYVEGHFVSLQYGIMCHAWLEIDGEIIDPTPGFDYSVAADYSAIAKFPYRRVCRNTEFYSSGLPVVKLADRRDEHIRASLVRMAMRYSELAGSREDAATLDALRQYPPRFSEAKDYFIGGAPGWWNECIRSALAGKESVGWGRL